MKATTQIRHEQLIDFLSKFDQYRSDGKCVLEKFTKTLTLGEIESLSKNDINNAVVVFTDTLNIMSGSTANFDLYRLLQAYLTIPKYRDRINKIVDEALML